MLRPFFAGVFPEDGLATSSRVLDLVWRSMLRGSAVLPAQGIGAVARQMAEDLPAGTIAYECTVRTLSDDGAVLADGTEIGARRVIVAADPETARALVPGLPEVEVNAVTTYYHVAPREPINEPLLVVDAESIVLNSLVVSNVQPIDEAKVRARLAELYDTDTASWGRSATTPSRRRCRG